MCLKKQSIAETIKLRKERFYEIKRKEKNINNELFKAYFTDYQSPCIIYKKLSEIENASLNQIWVNLIKKVWTKFKKIFDDVPKDENLYLKLKRLK